jgi:hypothetical protein
MHTAIRIVVFFQTSNFASPSPAEGIQYQSLQRRRHHQIFRNLLFLGILRSVAVLSYLYSFRTISENKSSEVSLLLALIDVENIERFEFYKKQRPKREVSEPEVLLLSFRCADGGVRRGDIDTPQF